MGWERKRGKLHELNRLLRGAADTTFIDSGSRSLPTGIRYVVTLDSDTRLPRDAIQRLVGKMAHPLNRPRLDTAESRVVEGYGVLQPRVTPSLPVGAEGSLFQRIFSSNSGIDPYSSAVSDVYQDLFGEGSYSGKGIYDVDAFEAALQGRVPDNAMLSHDLFEGVFARSGLVSDIEVVEEFPARYDVASARQHRWARGDWQLLPWLLGRVEGRAPDKAHARPGDRLVEDVRQPAAHAVRAGCDRGAPGGLDAAAPGRARLDGLRPADRRAADAPAGDRGACAAALRHHGAQPFLRARVGCPGCPGAVRAARGLPRPPGLADAGCDRPHLVSALRQPSPSARLDHRGPVQEHASHRLDRLRQPDGGKPPHCIAGRSVRLVCRRRGDGWLPRPSSSPGCSRLRSRAG